MSWLFGKSKKQQEETEWIANLPKDVEDDPRLGLEATADDGCTGVIDSIHRFNDGFEYFHIYNDQTGIGHGGLTSDQITFKP